MVMPSGEAGAYLVHFTGSAAHNVRLRGLARDRGWSLSEHGFVRLGEDGRPLEGDAAERRTFATEAEVYAFLGLPFIEPELREDSGEIEAAQAGRLPGLVSLADLQGDAHSHSDWSDGHLSIEAVADATRRRGHAYQVLTDHSRSLAIANGLSIERVEQQRAIIAELNARFAQEEAEGRAPEVVHPDGFRLLHGCELEIRTDGQLDYPDELLARFDVVVASLHVGRRQPRAQLMARYRTALRNPHVDIIAHPSGRKIGIRDDLDLDWDALYTEAAETGTLLEINGSDERLDLADGRIRRAHALGCRFVVDSDAHYRHEYDNLAWGVALARRGWLEPMDVLNTRPRDAFLAWLGGDRRV
jgi:DNA polymerase (family 10)